MPLQPELIKTEADILVQMLSRAKKLSMAEAAEKIGVPVATVEAWATFLEEEGVLSIKYEFTTPYLVYVEKKVAPTAGSLIKSELGFQEEFQRTEHDEAEKEEEPETVAAKHISFDVGADYLTVLDTAYHLMKQHKFAQAKQLYEQLVQTYQDMPAEFMMKRQSLQDQLVKLNKDLDTNTQKFKIDEMKYRSGKVRELLKNAYDVLKGNDFKGANSYYEEASALIKLVPDGFPQEKELLQKEAIRLYRAITDAEKKYFSLEINGRTRQILELISKVKERMQNQDLEGAVAIYNQIKQIYDNLPQGFLEQKIDLQKQILFVYDQLSNSYTERLVSSFDQQLGQVQALIAEMRQQLEQNNTDGAHKAYDLVMKIYKELPEGFLEQKLDVQNQILEMYSVLVSRSGDHIPQKVDDKFNDLGLMISRAFEAMAQNDAEKARFLYADALKYYNMLPPGYLERKSELRNKLVELHKKLSFAVEQKKQARLAAEQQKQAAPVREQVIIPVQPRQAAAESRPNADVHKELMAKIAELKAKSVPQLKVVT